MEIPKKCSPVLPSSDKSVTSVDCVVFDPIVRVGHIKITNSKGIL